MTTARNNKGQFTKKEETQPKKKPECTIWSALNLWGDNHEECIATVIVIFIIWLVLTGLFWVFAQKKTVVEECGNDSAYWYSSYHCWDVDQISYYSFYELVKMQFDWIIQQPGNLVGWIWQHPVITPQTQWREYANCIARNICPHKEQPQQPDIMIFDEMNCSGGYYRFAVGNGILEVCDYPKGGIP